MMRSVDLNFSRRAELPAQLSHAGPPSVSGWLWNFRARDREGGLSSATSGTGAVQVRSVKMARLEAALLVAGGPLTIRRLVQVATLADAAEAGQLIQDLNRAYDLGEVAFRIERVATGYQLLTRPEFAHWLSRLHQRQADLKLTPAALETLTILAYRQPVTRADLEAIRGVQCTDLLKLLMERGLIRIAGEDESLGRPFLYETTRKFLENYGLRNLDDLPGADQLRGSASKSSAVSLNESEAA